MPHRGKEPASVLRLPFRSDAFPAVFLTCVSPNNAGSVPMFRVFNLTCVQILMHAIALGGCTKTVIRESVLKVDSGRKIPCCTEEWNPRQY